MGRITVETTIENGTDSTFRVRCDTLVEQAQAAVDLVGHRLVKVNRVDLK